MLATAENDQPTIELRDLEWCSFVLQHRERVCMKDKEHQIYLLVPPLDNIEHIGEMFHAGPPRAKPGS